MRLMGLCSVPVWIAYGLQEWLVYDHLAGALLLFAGALATGSAGVVRKRIGLDASIHFVCAAFVLSLVGLEWLRGGFHISVLQWGVMLPIGTFVIGDIRAAVGWTVALVVGAISVWLAETTGMITPKFELAPMTQIASTSLMLLFGLVLGGIFHRTRVRVERQRDQLRTYLSDASKMQSLGRIAGGVAHDFNNLLAVINTRADVARQELDAEHPARRHLDALAGAVEKGSELVEELMSFGREEFHEPRVVDPDRIVGQTMELLAKILPDNIKVDTHLGGAEAKAMIDPVRLGQVVIDLCTHARDAMPAGGRLDVRTNLEEITTPRKLTRGKLSPGSYWVAAIVHTGPEMSQQMVERMFDPLFASASRDDGSVPGLVAVGGALRAASACLDVRVDPGRGSVFSVYLPVVDDCAVTASVDVPSGALRIGEFTVLYAEDDDDVREATRFLLERAGARVLIARDGHEALAFLDGGERPDVLLTDVLMPGMSGPELARAARAKLAGLRVVFVSGYAADTVDGDLLAAPGTEFLRKPFSRDELLGALRPDSTSIRAST